MWWSRDKGSLDERISRRKLQRVADRIKGSVRECIRFESEIARNEDNIPVGATKIGGRADLPASTPWPGGDPTPMTFIALIDTSKLPPFNGRADLPADTLLSFFFDLGTSPRGYHPKDRSGWQVLATPLGTPLVRRGEGIASVYTPCVLKPWKDLSLPDPASDEVGAWGLDSREDDAYIGLWKGLMPAHAEDGENHQLLGYASTIEGDLHILCELASTGIYWRTVGPKVYEPEMEPLRNAATEWRLLLQIDSDKRADFRMLNAGRLYFYIRDRALKAGAFDEAWAVVQTRGARNLP